MQGVTDIVAALAQWTTDASRLIGVFESQELEFKKVAYRLGDDEGKSEFAKDVCAMANAGGGLIILGVETERDPTVGRDVSVRVRPLASDSISTSQTEDVARTWIYPPQRALTIREWPDDASGKMLVSIEVPNLSDPGGLALILGPGSPPDRRTVGVPIRSEARVDFHLAPELYDWIRRGRSQSVPSNDEVSSAATTQAAEDQLERVRVDFVDADPTGNAVFYIQVWPEQPTRLDGIFDSDGVRGLFLDPPSQRYAGFSWWGLRPEVDSGGGIRVSSGEVAYWITPAAIATLVLHQSDLTWAMERYQLGSKGPLINATALGEFIFEFCRAYVLLLRWAVPTPSRATFRFGIFRAATPLALHLGKGRPETIEYAHSAVPAKRDQLVDSIASVDLSMGEGKLAATMLKRFYGLFGLGREAIPHLSPDGESFDPGTLGGSREG